MRTRAVFTLAALLLVVPACDRKSDGSPAISLARTGVDKIKAVHRGELSAVATYEDVLKKNDTAAWRPDLERRRTRTPASGAVGRSFSRRAPRRSETHPRATR